MLISSKLVIRQEAGSSLYVARLLDGAGDDDERLWGGGDFSVSI